MVSMRRPVGPVENPDVIDQRGLPSPLPGGGTGPASGPLGTMQSFSDSHPRETTLFLVALFGGAMYYVGRESGRSERCRSRTRQERGGW